MASKAKAPAIFDATDDTTAGKHVQLYSERFFRMDRIRASKILEICQYAIISFWFNIVIGSFLDKLFPEFDPKKNAYMIAFEITYQIFVLSIFMYYSNKLLSIIPFFFALTSTYVSNLKGEISIGLMSAPLALLATQQSLIQKVTHLQTIVTRKLSPSNSPSPA